MAFTNITKKAVGDTPDKAFLDAIIDNLNDLNARLSPSSRAQLIDNPSFEIDADSDGDPDKWTFTDYSGGSHALDTDNDSHGSTSIAFTSTVLANGGGYCENEDFVEVAGNSELNWRISRKASVSNVSCQLLARWYDDAQSFVSSSTLFQDTSTPTSATFTSGVVTSPGDARYVKLRVEGGVPSVGSATGIVYFDGLTFIENPPDDFILPRHIVDGTLGQELIKTDTVSLAGTLTEGATTVFTLSSYSLFPMIHATDASASPTLAPHTTDQADPNTPAFAIIAPPSKVNETYDIDYRYITAV